MQTFFRSWLPTSPREQVFLFSLSLSLMLNTTVVLLLVTGDLPTLSALQAKPTPAMAEQGKPGPAEGVVDAIDRAAQPHAIDRALPVLTEPSEPVVVEAASLADGPSAATPVVSAAAAVALPEPAKPVQQAQPVTDDPPVTFFGVGIE